eukprot:COSAG04_NODE_10_length_43369_cov_4.059025_42_plen_963_part_00
MPTTADMEAGLVAAVPNPLSMDALRHPSVQPDFTHLEGRAVSAAFLRWFRAEKVTDELKQRATAAAIPYLEGQIERRTQEIAELQGAKSVEAVEDSAEGRKRHAIKLTNAKRWLGWLRTDLEQRQTEPFVTARDIHRYIVKAETDDLLCRYCELPGMAEQKDPETDMYHYGTADHFFSYNWDSPFDDVVDAMCAHSDRAVAEGKPPQYYFIDNFAMSQHYKTSEAEAAKKRAGDPDFSYDFMGGTWGRSTTACPACPNCPGPWDRCYECPCESCRKGCYDMTDWTRRQQQLEEHDADLQAALRQVQIHGFERVIQHTRSTVMLMEPPDCPRAPTRVWCLFEGNATLRYGGRLEGILSAVRQSKLRLELNKKFKEMETVVSNLDSRSADATGEDDKIKIFGAIQQDLARGHDELDENVQSALRRWLADAAEGVIRRTDPNRPPLDEAEMAQEAAETGDRWCTGVRCYRKVYPFSFCPEKRFPALELTNHGAKLTRLLEELPQLPALLIILPVLIMAVLVPVYISPKGIQSTICDEHTVTVLSAQVATTCCPPMDPNCAIPTNCSTRCADVFKSSCHSNWTKSPDHASCRCSTDARFRDKCNFVLPWSQDDAAPVRLFVTVSALAQPMMLGYDLQQHQKERQLRQPPLLGNVAAQNSGTVWSSSLFIFVVLPLFVLGGRSSDNFSYICSGICLHFAVSLAVAAAKTATSERASLVVKAGWLRLALGEAEDAAAAAKLFGIAHDELQNAFPRHPVNAWEAAAGYGRALCEAGRQDEAEALRAALDAMAKKRMTTAEHKLWSAYLRARMAAALRAPDDTVLDLLHATFDGVSPRTGATNAYHAGTQRVPADGQPEWDEFLSRMAEGAGGKSWEIYRTQQILYTQKWVRKLPKESGLGHSSRESVQRELLQLRALPEEAVLGMHESEEQRCVRLFEDVFSHPAWGQWQEVEGEVESEPEGAAKRKSM